MSLAALRSRIAARRASRALALEARVSSTRLAWEPPARTVTVAGVHGGAGATTLTLLLAHALTSIGHATSLTIDLAGRGRGGLAVFAGAASETTAEATSAVAVHGRSIGRPYAVNEAGVRIIGAYPDGVEELDRSHEATVARIVAAVARETDDTRLAAMARAAAREQESLRALRWDAAEPVEAITRVIDRAVAHHALVALDLGMLDSDQLARTVSLRSDLHVWVLPGRIESLQIAERRLPLTAPEPAGAEAICVWRHEPGGGPSAKRLATLGELRGCPVVRLANHGHGADWPARVVRCLSGLEELCELAA